MNTSTKFNFSSTQTVFTKKKALSTSLSTGNFPMISSLSNKPLNLKSIKVTDMYKNLYHKDTGKVINSILVERDSFKNDIFESNKKKYYFIKIASIILQEGKSRLGLHLLKR